LWIGHFEIDLLKKSEFWQDRKILRFLKVEARFQTIIKFMILMKGEKNEYKK